MRKKNMFVLTVTYKNDTIMTVFSNLQDAETCATYECSFSHVHNATITEVGNGDNSHSLQVARYALAKSVLV